MDFPRKAHHTFSISVKKKKKPWTMSLPTTPARKFASPKPVCDAFILSFLCFVRQNGFINKLFCAEAHKAEQQIPNNIGSPFRRENKGKCILCCVCGGKFNGAAKPTASCCGCHWIDRTELMEWQLQNV